ncbi:hypothetical protein QUF84_21925 [Fictibacillus enclensis]|uniref:hypothetical protein n=1 Tax=Fictibacillus enclensis TaxID=1017270 RepID=UPI0025A0CF85|nr:hypothetical protein [Fictibacillus enclensis]MDM5339858.1 hypothetical protein [Fictibacillus enclensis]
MAASNHMMEATTSAAKRKSIKNVNPLQALFAAAKRRRRKRNAANAETAAAAITGAGFSNPCAGSKKKDSFMSFFFVFS